MKYLISPMLVLAALIANGQDPQPLPARSIFKISPQHFTQRQLKIGFERLNRSYSQSLSLYLNGLLAWSDDYGYEEDYSGLGAELQYRKYLVPLAGRTTKKGNTYYRGIYFSGYLQGGRYSGTQSGTSYNYDHSTGTSTSTPYNYKEDIGNWGGGFTFGFQQTLWSKIFFEVYIGGGLQFADRNTSGNVPDSPYYYYFYDSGITALDYQGILPKIGLQVGIGL
ncbi:MAG TPA: hypothetical protein VFW11_05160 [Cyclobacteriaceae bacterium]|nr:hypothetical protein [Cyclobacteriaceae bacterium]